MKKLIILTIICAGLASCVSAPTAEQMQNADYGNYPDNYETIIKSYMSRLLKDPVSATYDCGSANKGWAGGGLSGPIQYGYGVSCYINAKNSFGGYVGAKKYNFLIRNGQVVYNMPAFD